MSLEAATELWISLTDSLQTGWLEFSGPAGHVLLEEVHAQGEAAYEFMVERRIER